MIQVRNNQLVATSRRYSVGILLCAVMMASNVLAADSKNPGELRDLFFGEALYHHHQQDYFTAVTLLDAELTQLYSLDDPKQDSLSFHREESELLVGDMELSYRMHQRVGRAMQRLLDKSVHDSIRDRAAFRLARIAFKKSAYDDALQYLDAIGKSAPAELTQQAALLRGQALIALERYPQAIEVLKPVQGASALTGYAAYNLGVAYTEAGDPASAFLYLNKVGTMNTGDRELSALRDKANLTIGAALLKAGKAAEARPYLERVQIKSAFANKALLWVGWSSAGEGKYEQALVPWMLLRQRDITDVAVQEALLAAPYGFGQLKAYGKSAVLYGEAVDKIDREISRLDDSMRSIREGKFLKAMLSEEAKHQEQWLFKLGSVKDAPETRYLRNLMAGHAFNESYQNYRELDQLRRNLERGLQDVAAYQDLLQLRRRHYAPLLDQTDSAYARAQKRLATALSRRDVLAASLGKLLQKRDPMRLATAKERHLKVDLQRSRRKVESLRALPGKDILLRKQALLEGLLHWDIESDYNDRLSRAHQHLRELDQEIARAQLSQTELTKAKAAAALSYQGYDRALQGLQERLTYLLGKTEGLIAHQGQYMERRAISELMRRKQRLQQYRTKARFAMAESYDLALRKQSGKKK